MKTPWGKKMGVGLGRNIYNELWHLRLSLQQLKSKAELAFVNGMQILDRNTIQTLVQPLAESFDWFEKAKEATDGILALQKQGKYPPGSYLDLYCKHCVLKFPMLGNLLNNVKDHCKPNQSTHILIDSINIAETMVNDLLQDAREISTRVTGP